MSASPFTGAAAGIDPRPDRPAPRPLPRGRAALQRGALACADCGQAVDGGAVVESIPLQTGPLPAQVHEERFSRCESCTDLRVDAEDSAPGDPGVARVLVGLAAIGRPLPRAEQVLDAARFFAGLDSCWASRFFVVGTPLVEQPGTCAASPWSHVGDGQRAVLRRAYGEFQRWRVLGEAPRDVRCPSGGCAICGVESVTVEWDADLGSTWRPVIFDRSALGGRGPGRVDGHLCSSCSEAFDAAGAIGPGALVRALSAHLLPGKGSLLLDEVEVGGLVGWASTRGREPNREPFEHLHDDLDDLRKGLANVLGVAP